MRSRLGLLCGLLLLCALLLAETLCVSFVLTGALPATPLIALPLAAAFSGALACLTGSLVVTLETL